MKRFFILAGPALVLVMLGLIGLWLYLKPPGDAPVFPHGQLVIARADGQKISFDVDIATTPEQERYGLMHRHALAENGGMLFIYDPPDAVSMWMRDTPIPLDMLFVRADGTIAKIVTHTVPFDVTPIDSDEPVRGVVELDAGAVDHFGLTAGDRLLYPGFSGQ